MIEKLYFISVLLISVLILYLYFNENQEYKRELLKIETLEREQDNKQRQLELIRSKTIPCHIGSLASPRSCYIDSGYQCSWNVDAERCDKIL